MILLKFLGIIILLFIIFVLTLVFSVVFGFWGFFRKLTGNTNSQQQGYQQQRGYQGQWYRGGDSSSSGQTTSSGEKVSGQPKPRQSTVDKNEGEYVEFEEL